MLYKKYDSKYCVNVVKTNIRYICRYRMFARIEFANAKCAESPMSRQPGWVRPAGKVIVTTWFIDVSSTLEKTPPEQVASLQSLLSSTYLPPKVHLIFWGFDNRFHFRSASEAFVRFSCLVWEASPGIHVPWFPFHAAGMFFLDRAEKPEDQYPSYVKSKSKGLRE